MYNIFQVLNGLAEAYVSLKRVQKLLDTEDIDLNKLYTVLVKTKPDILGNLNERLVQIEIQDGNFQYHPPKVSNVREQETDDTAFQLVDVNVKIGRGELVCIKGSVGSGKTSLLLALMGSLKHSNGRIIIDNIQDGFAYVSQNPWLQRGTVRDNILWGNLFDESRYKAVSIGTRCFTLSMIF